MKGAMFIMLIFLSGFNTGNWWKGKGYENMHCQPITTHNTLEDAKAQVERYQERVGK